MMTIDLQQGLTVRTQIRGGLLARHVHPVGITGLQLEAAQRLVLLIHGYNTDLNEAKANYRTLLQNLTKDAETELYRTDLFLGFFWPGDLENRAASMGSYPWKVSTAIDAGKMLGIWLAQLNANLQIVIIAHSLGCRVALEAISQLDAVTLDERTRFPPIISGVSLMAAAVPVRMCQPRGGQFGKGHKYTSEYVLFSPRDAALGFSFFGQKMAGEGGWGPAVGFLGHPKKRWDPRRKNTWLSHGEYFQSETASDVVCSLLDYRVTRKQEQERPAERYLVKHQLDANEKEHRRLADPLTWICKCANGTQASPTTENTHLAAGSAQAGAY
jgi:pimeloyl-ACP methyl ester carboxylesterase